MKNSSSLYIKNLQLPIHLGWRDDERAEKQRVFLNVSLHFAEPPKGCETENLDDTICYSLLINHLRETLAKKQFHLIEHLTYKIYHLIKDYLSHHYPTNALKISAQITKKPNIPGLENVSFTFGDAD